ncbi:tetratricopeptide repeat protein [Micromonospora tulbaghiae]|uniref:Tetratricopeptide repeat protein n=1 Tax=Micromonospora tulbaghiae TaxID=479978 RepID=A0AAW4JD99_9ACTN|nr:MULTISPECIES: FxSxx-COOH system tetratricopeptide repeat protein [Micromonospora]KAB1909743.1 tetratricopeptide repeat protein [Micromonospora sp. AMSO1212t]MBO4139370.1 tetratricopeptide repeat protein [Micromonospora tulbaghiae]
MTRREGQVVTFYSYKGGTGRTMALANVAWILAANGKRVLAVDWDLESPGLSRFFAPFIDRDALESTGGVIDLIREYEWATTTKQDKGDDRWHEQYARVHKYSFSLNWSNFPGDGTLDFLGAGQQNNDYAGALAGMNWDEFYERQGGGYFFDALRADMKRNYDYVLIDSRTGFSDVADICTIQLPDVLVTCFTLSEQGITGAAKVARLVEHRYGSRRIRVLPVPMRIDPAEKVKADTGRAVARQRFSGLPSGMSEADRDRYWARMQVPYQAFYAYEELLATFADQPGVNGSLLSAYEVLAREITRGEVESLPPMSSAVRERVNARFTRTSNSVENEILLRHAPYDRVWAEWIGHLLVSADVRVTDPWFAEDETPRTARELIIVSESNATEEAVLAAPDRSPDQVPLVVYVADVRRLANVPAAHTVSVAGLEARTAAARILRLVGREGVPADLELPTGPRFPGRDNTVFEVPGRNKRFTGREADLRELRTLLRSSPKVVLSGTGPVALQGMGGIGKSQLALEYAHRYRAAYDMVWWIDADQVPFIESAIGDLAPYLGVPSSESNRENARLVLQALRRTDLRWLLIMDNADEIEGVLPYVPDGKGHVLITSRNLQWVERATTVQVDVFKRAESIQHLTERVPTMRVDQADRIAALLGDLPIAVTAAAAWLADTGHSVDSYLNEIAKFGPGAVMEPNSNVSVEATWELSLNHLRTRNPAAYRVLQLCSVFAPEISADLVYSDEFAEALVPFHPQAKERLVRQQLVQQANRLALVRVDLRAENPSGSERGRGGLVLMHRLLQHAVRSRMTEVELDEARQQVHLVLAAARPEGEVDDPDGWPRFRVIWPHLEASKAPLSRRVEVRALMIDRVRYLQLRGDLETGRRLGQEVAQTWEQMLAEETDPRARDDLRRQLLHLQFNLANILAFLGQFTESRALDEEVLGAQRELLGEDHPHTLMTAGGLARDLRGMGMYNEALRLDEITFNAWKRNFTEEHPRTLAALNNLASTQRLMGDFREARKNDEMVLAGRRAILGENHPDTLASSTYVGIDMRDAGDFEQSVTRLRSVHRDLLHTAGPEHLITLRTQTNLAVSLRAAGHAVEAGKLLEAAYELLNERFGPDNPETLTCRLSLSINLLTVDLFQRASRELTEVHRVYQRNLGPMHPLTLVCMVNLAMVARRAGDFAEARQLAGRSADALAGVLGSGHPYPLSGWMNQGICIAEQPDPPEGREAADLEALNLLRRAHDGLVRILGRDHTNTLRCRANLVVMQERVESGRRAELEAVTRELTYRLGENHPAVEAVRESRLQRRIIDPHPI